jgi:hypothetical protein
MHSGQTSCKVKYSDSLQRRSPEESQGIRKAKHSPALQRWLQEPPDQSYFTGLSQQVKPRVKKSLKKVPWTPLSPSQDLHSLPIRIITQNTEDVGGAIGRENCAICLPPKQPSVEPPNSAETKTPTSSDKAAIEPDEPRLLARKVYTVLGSSLL